MGVSDSANPGTVTQQQLEARTVYRPGELLEATPGLIVSQHSGEGKANQFYLRGFNLDWLTVDADIAFAHACFREVDAAGQRVPGAVEGVASVAAAVDKLGPWFGAVQFRYFGPRPLIEDNSVRSASTSTLNARVGYKINPRTRIELEGFNLTNRKASAIDYFYTSRLRGEPAAGVADSHFHPIESRSLRVTLAYSH